MPARTSVVRRCRLSCAAINTERAGGISQSCGCWEILNPSVSASSAKRAPFPATAAAALAGNGALLALLAETEGFSISQHPQLWLIPPALSVLIAAQLNRQRLTTEVLAGIRYAATTLIYLSSTSEIFIKDMGT